MKTLFTVMLFLTVSCQKSIPEPVNYSGSYITPKTTLGHEIMLILKQYEDLEATVYDSSQVYFLKLRKNGDQFSGSITQNNKTIELRIYKSSGKTSAFYLVSFPDSSKNYGFVGEIKKQ